MGSVADDLRRRTAEQVIALPVAARIELALSLGDEDLALYAGHAALGADVARRRLQAQRSRGRVPSVVNRLPAP
jgi:hypothetical protein